MTRYRATAVAAVLCLSSSFVLEPLAAGRSVVASAVFSEVHRPIQVRASTAGDIFLLSEADHSVVQLRRRGNLVRRFGRIGNGQGELYRPVDFAISASGHVWVADAGNDRVVWFRPDGEYEGHFSLRGPVAVAALPTDEIAVVSSKDVDLVRVFGRDGRQLRTIGQPIPVDAANTRQEAYFNRGRLATSGDSLFYVFRAMLQPTIHRYSFTGELRATLHPWGSAMPTIVGDARLQRDTALQSGALSYRGTLNAMAIHPRTGDVWVAPAGPELYVYSQQGAKLLEVTVKGPDGKLLGAQALTFGTDGTGYMIAGRGCFAFGPEGVTE